MLGRSQSYAAGVAGLLLVLTPLSPLPWLELRDFFLRLLEKNMQLPYLVILGLDLSIFCIQLGQQTL